MMSTSEPALMPSPPVLPALPLTDFWDETQWAVFLALVEAVIPSISPESCLEDPHHQIRISDHEFQEAFEDAVGPLSERVTVEKFKTLLADRPTTDKAFVENIKRSIEKLPVQQRTQLGNFCNTLSGRIGSFFLAGCCTPIHLLPVHTRERIVRGWTTSRLTRLRTVAKSIQVLAQRSYFQTNPLFKELSGYSDVPRNYKPGVGHDFQFLQFDAGNVASEASVVETDVVIVGSGIGGSVCAKMLAEAGNKVMVVDKAYHFPPSQLPMPQETASQYLMDNGGFVGADDGSAFIVAGSVWGGGGTVNWSVGLQTQQFVREEWDGQVGSSFFTSPEYQEGLDWAFKVMGVATDGIRHNHANRVMLQGAEKLGWQAAVAPQNSGGKEHYCGQCFMGCGSNEKRGPTVSLLPAAADAGAIFIEGLQVSNVILDDKNGLREAVGVVGEWISRDKDNRVSGPIQGRITRRVEIKAKKVIVACGSLWTPVVLMNSGLKNPNIGKNLHLHPCQMVAGVFKYETRPWEGGIITSYCSEFENLDGTGYGVKLEPTCMVPYAFLSTMPQDSGLETKTFGLKYPRVNGFISLTRDRDSGRVFPDPISGKPRVSYTVSEYDRAHTLEGVVALAKLCYAMGATEIRANFPRLQPFVRSGGSEAGTKKAKRSDTTDTGADDRAFRAWLGRVREVGNKPPVTLFSSAHQMGSCRIGRSEDDSAVDIKGKVWGCENLFVADASVFPSASGVNPMCTTMALARHIALGISQELAGIRRNPGAC